MSVLPAEHAFAHTNDLIDDWIPSLDGVEGRLRAADYPTNGRGSDLICFFDCFHDLGDPLGAAQHTRDALAGERTLREAMMAAGFQGCAGQPRRRSTSCWRHCHEISPGRRRHSRGLQ